MGCCHPPIGPHGGSLRLPAPTNPSAILELWLA
jgi:hypothetical protein